MEKLEKEIEQDELESEYEEEESEEDIDEDEIEKDTKSPEPIDPKLDPFDEINQKVKTVLPRKILAKGIASDFRPIEEESLK